VRQIFLAFPEARAHLRTGARTEVVEIGNPIAPPDRSIDRAAARRRFGLGDGPVALVVGGSQGARAVNEALLRDLAAVVERSGGVSGGRASEGKLSNNNHPGDFVSGDSASGDSVSGDSVSGDEVSGDNVSRPAGLSILWATGPANHAAVAAEITRLGIGDWVRAEPYISDMPMALAAADIAVSRSGAMMLAELCAWGIPAILVPFPHAAANHQHHNAVALADAGAAVLIPESDLAPGRLWNELVALVTDDARRAALATRATERGNPDAAREIVAKMATLLGAPSTDSPVGKEAA
jgi:UDP-N-acetylglucosamine--N-acetylmuramyl-(pentapeptide) pyrophosphoryl-undecaprenol N-acetylglucosamine transferase